MMGDIPAALRRTIVERAVGRCEYCGLSQIGQEAVFHIDHVVPAAAGGSTTEGNLALACVSCSLRKGSRRRGFDPQSCTLADLFNPRKDRWNEHFRFEGMRVVGLTAIGRATILALQLNRPMILAIRHEEALRGRHPPS